MNITRQCQNFIEDIGEEVTGKLHDLSDELTQDLEYTGIPFETPKFVAQDTDDVQGGLLLAAPLLALTPIGWAGAAIVGLGALFFGESQSKKIEKAKNALREKLIPSRNEIRDKTNDNVLKILNEQVLYRQIDGFGRTLESMSGTMENLAYAQNVVADTINRSYKKLNTELINRAIQTAQQSDNWPDNVVRDYPDNAKILRIVGEEFCIIFEDRITFLFGAGTDIYFANAKTLLKLLGEKITEIKIPAFTDNYWRDLGERVKEDILHCDFEFKFFVKNENTGDMHVICLPRYETFNDTQIQLVQQLYEDPVYFE